MTPAWLSKRWQCLPYNVLLIVGEALQVWADDDIVEVGLGQQCSEKGVGIMDAKLLDDVIVSHEAIALQHHTPAKRVSCTGRCV
jgi:hypothetical protein